ncbi:hypothetical protein PIB30_002016 [Stylosanthes scabra]|uniref:Uncharacterized protein n=1 Tax=Stylosanthes scabra TaxID=79078 RepID=A0ABU6Q3Y2_9FABA|nr:hypothetical protein [Stylosanthes scabra]
MHATVEDEAAAMEDRATRLETESCKTAIMPEVGGDNNAADLSKGDERQRREMPASNGALGAVVTFKVENADRLVVKSAPTLRCCDTSAVGMGYAKVSTAMLEAKPQKTIGNRGSSAARLLTVPCWTIGDEQRKGTAVTPVIAQIGSIATERVEDTQGLSIEYRNRRKGQCPPCFAQLGTLAGGLVTTAVGDSSDGWVEVEIDSSTVETERLKGEKSELAGKRKEMTSPTTLRQHRRRPMKKEETDLVELPIVNHLGARIEDLCGGTEGPRLRRF